ncbi:hemin ABC transporter substrate-binding protein [Luteimonas yindakuii]|uniref:Hemin ABC transporter substrate-binding protein n=1 Tax=Luteimonas yindakuii TaxID=2565782 RepID=A0A4Z1R1V8_9GAMM|nr:ABC transporter substrate-binding protein [Luteimonas yindakuii]TKS53492.1 hemin ABC transporter substrate-binding protein [Luteimonas yindakuii]
MPDRRTSRPSTAALAACLALALAACSPSAPPAATTGVVPATAGGATALPGGWQRVVGVDVPDAEGVHPRLPATVRSDDGVEVTVTDSSRTIAGGDDVISVMEALGLDAQVFAAPVNTATAAGRAAPKQFLFNRTTGAEGVLSLDATLFVGNSLRRHGNSGLAGKLRDAGLPAVIVDDLQPAPDKVRKTAALFGAAEAGEHLATQVQAQLDEAARIAAGHARRPKVIHVSATGAGGQPTVGGADTAAAALIRLAGGDNIGDAAGVSDYSVLSQEGIVAAAPEVILVSEHDLELFGGADALWTQYPTLRQTPAGAAGRVWVMPDVQLKYTSVASGAGAIALAQALSALAADEAP